MSLRNKKMKPKALVNKATSDDRTPPSGYILEELASMCQSILNDVKKLNLIHFMVFYFEN